MQEVLTSVISTLLSNRNYRIKFQWIYNNIIYSNFNIINAAEPAELQLKK